MARDHARVLIRIWADEDWKVLTESEQRLYVLLLSQERINRAGVLDLRIRPWSKLAADSTVESIVKALRGLENARFIAVDPETEEVLVRSFIRNDGIVRQPNVLKNALSAAQQVQSPRLRAILADELRKLIDSIPVDRRDQEANRDGVQRIADLLVHSNAKGSSNPSGNPSANPSDGDQVHDAEISTSTHVSTIASEPFSEPFGEGFVEPPGEGEGVGEGEVVISVGGSVASKQRRSLRGLAQTATDPRTAVILGAWRNSHSPRYSGGTYTAIGKHVAQLLTDGHSHETVEMGLAEWDRRSDAKPGLLPHLVDDLVHQRRAGAVTKPVIVNGKAAIPVDQIADDQIDPDDILGPDYWTMPPPPREIDDGPFEGVQAWAREQVAARRAERVAEARRKLIRRQNRSSA